MPDAPKPKTNRRKADPWYLPAVDCLLIAAIKAGPLAKRAAINKVLERIPQMKRGDCWRRIRQLRKSPELAALNPPPSHGDSPKAKSTSAARFGNRPWTADDDEKLLDLAGYQTVKAIAHKRGRTEAAVRYRLSALGASAQITDGWSLRRLQKTLRVSRTRLRALIGSGILEVRDSNVSAESVRTFVERRGASLDAVVVEKIKAVLAGGQEGYTWYRASQLFGVSKAQIQSWISDGSLRVVDPFVTDLKFQKFCRKHGDQINTAIMDPETARWLLSEYRVRKAPKKTADVSRAQKHALVLHTCQCGRKISGNVYFRHSKRCPVATGASLRRAA